MQKRVSFRVWGAQAHLLRIVDPMTGQPLTIDRIEDEASILFIAGASHSVLSRQTSNQCDSKGGAQSVARFPEGVCKCIAPCLQETGSWQCVSQHSVGRSLLGPCSAAHSPVAAISQVQCRDFVGKLGAPFYLPGSETTGYTMAWVLYLLAKHPAAMAKLEAELDAAGLLVTPARPRPRPFTFPDISKLPFLDAVLKARCMSILGHPKPYHHPP